MRSQESHGADTCPARYTRQERRPGARHLAEILEVFFDVYPLGLVSHAVLCPSPRLQRSRGEEGRIVHLEDSSCHGERRGNGARA